MAVGFGVGRVGLRVRREGLCAVVWRMTGNRARLRCLYSDAHGMRESRGPSYSPVTNCYNVDVCP